MMFFAPQRRSRAPVPEAGSGEECDTARLLQRLGAGDTLALDELYRREADRVYRYALAVCGDSALAADATQEAFVALATRPQSFDAGRGALGAYLAGVARHALSARWRELRRETPLGEGEGAGPGSGCQPAGGPDAARVAGGDAPPDELLGAAASPETLLVRAQEVQALWAALRALPVVFREAVVLVDLQERSYVEAAQIAGLQLNTLRTRLHRARARLAVLLGAAEDRPRVPGTDGETT